MAISYEQMVAQKKQYLKGATASQKKAINYFVPETGCIGLFTGIKDEDYDEIVKELVSSSNSAQKAIQKIGIDESELQEIAPVTLFGYEPSDFSKVGRDHVTRTNLYSITHLYFSATQVYMYQLIMNTMKNEKKERTEEYFYRDITNFSTLAETIEALELKGCKGEPVRVSADIQRFALVVPGDKFSCSTTGDIDDQIRAMKNKLREKKNA